MLALHLLQSTLVHVNTLRPGRRRRARASRRPPVGDGKHADRDKAPVGREPRTSSPACSTELIEIGFVVDGQCSGEVQVGDGAVRPGADE